MVYNRYNVYITAQKKQWYFAGVPAAPHRTAWTMDEIRNSYGSAKFTAKREEERAQARPALA